MFSMGVAQGRKMALQELPITKVQPAVPKIEIKPLHLPPGMWSKQWYETHPEHRATIPQQRTYWPAPFEEQAWLNSKPLTVEPELEGDPTERMTAIKKLEYVARKLG
jgi:hypothetical protein